MGFNVERTGQFGIGVLSYFMLAKEVVVKTTRFQGCGDYDGPGWHFVTQGISDFGELRKAKNSPFPAGGSRIEMRLREGVVQGPSDFAEEILSYLTYILVSVPCVFRFRTEGFAPDNHNWEVKTGWVPQQPDYLEYLKSRWKESQEKLSEFDRVLDEEGAAKREYLINIELDSLRSARADLRCAIREVGLPENLGQVQLILPYFESPKGRSLVRPFTDQNGIVFKKSPPGSPSNDLGWKPELISKIAWKGMTCRLNQFAMGKSKVPVFFDLASNCSYVINFTDSRSGTLEVNREHLALTRATADKVDKFINEQSSVLTDEILQKDESPLYVNINCWERGRALTLAEGTGWFLLTEDGPKFAPISLPAVGFWNNNINFPMLRLFGRVYDSDHRECSVLYLPIKSGRFSGKIATRGVWPIANTIHALTLPNNPFITFTEGSASQQPEQIPVAVWSSENKTERTTFPPEWGDVFFVQMSGHLAFVNTDHALGRLLEPSQIAEIETKHDELVNISWGEVENIDSGVGAVWWLCHLASVMMTNGIGEKWNKFQKAFPPVADRIWNLASTASGVPIDRLKFYAWFQSSLFFLDSTGAVGRSYRNRIPSFTLPRITDARWTMCHRVD